MLVTAFIAAGLLSVAADDLPKAQAFARYEAMMKRSPFAVATAVAAPAPTPNFAKDLYIANAARTPDGDLITLASSTDKNFKKYLSTKEPVEGYSITEHRVVGSRGRNQSHDHQGWTDGDADV